MFENLLSFSVFRAIFLKLTRLTYGTQLLLKSPEDIAEEMRFKKKTKNEELKKMRLNSCLSVF
jgi:hypothetical protein